MTEVKVTSQKNTKTLTFKGLTDGQIISMMNALQHWGFEMGSPVAAELHEILRDSLQYAGLHNLTGQPQNSSDAE